MSFFTDITDSADEVSGDITTSFDKLNGAIDEIEKDVVQSLKSVMRAVLGVERKINKFWKAVMPLIACASIFICNWGPLMEIWRRKAKSEKRGWTRYFTRRKRQASKEVSDAV